MSYLGYKINTYTKKFGVTKYVFRDFFHNTKNKCIFIVSVYKFITSYTGTLVLHGQLARSHNNYRIIVVDPVLFLLNDDIINIVELRVDKK